ncbi:MAG TPA: HAD family phosphatase [Acidobacteriaceae bacterium]|nr:HAD family phosphatase [Acidobacteriaceae bacterium]
MQLRAVIFDYGEVLSQPANESIHQELLALTDLPEDVFKENYWAHRLDYDAAILNGRTYWQTIARDSGTEFAPAQIERLIELDTRMWMDINQPVLDYALEIRRSGLRTGILSNMGEDVLRAMRRQFSWLDEFNALIWSCELGIVKPDPAIYLEALQKLEVEPGEALFIDNLEVNIAGAEKVGLRGLVFRDAGQFHRDLRQFGIDLPSTQGAVTI